MERDNFNRILIRRRKRILDKKKIIKFTLFAFIAAISGGITSKIILDKYIQSNKLECNIKDKTGNFKEEVSRIITKISSSLVTISCNAENLSANTDNDGNVTGVIIDESGYIITSLAKVKNMSKLYIKTAIEDEGPIEGSIMGEDEFTDIALIKVNTENLTPMPIYSEADVDEGEVVISTGNVKSNELIGTITMGKIISTDKSVYDEEKRKEYKVLGTNAVINNDNIGGALCNLNGELIGFNSFTLNNGDSNLNYAFRAASAKEIVNYLLGITDKLGITGSAINDKEAGVSGVYIESVNPNSYAAKVGILPTDIIVAINNVKINKPEDINNAIKDKKSGDTIICDLLRDGKKTTMNIQIN